MVPWRYDGEASAASSYHLGVEETAEVTQPRCPGSSCSLLLSPFPAASLLCLLGSPYPPSSASPLTQNPPCHIIATDLSCPCNISMAVKYTKSTPAILSVSEWFFLIEKVIHATAKLKAVLYVRNIKKKKKENKQLATSPVAHSLLMVPMRHAPVIPAL